jgi:hypothetical protein
MENYSERIKDFMDRLSDEDREVVDNITSSMYEAGMEEGMETAMEEIKNNKQNRTTFGEPQPEDIKDLISLFPDMLESYNEGLKEALKYAGMVNVLSAVGIDIQTLQTIILNDMALKKQAETEEVDIESIIEEEARKY